MLEEQCSAEAYGRCLYRKTAANGHLAMGARIWLYAILVDGLTEKRVNHGEVARMEEEDRVEDKGCFRLDQPGHRV